MRSQLEGDEMDRRYTHRSESQRTGFSIVELLAVIAIIAVLLAIAIPAVQSARSGARRSACLNQMRQISLALHHYESAHQHFPSGVAGPNDPDFPMLSFLARSLPYLEMDALWQTVVDDYKRSRSPFHGGHRALGEPVALFQCPADLDVEGVRWSGNTQVALTSYLGVNGTDYQAEDGIFHVDSATTTSSIADGLTNTLLVGERPPARDASYGRWYATHVVGKNGSPDMLLGVSETNGPAPPGIVTGLESCPPGPYEFGPGNDDLCDIFHFWSRHPGGSIFAFADCHVVFIPYHVDKHVMQALATRSGGEPLPTLDSF